MGWVYRATQLKLDRPVALKLIASHLAEDETFRERFARESRNAAALDHPHVVPVHEADEIDGELFVVMRFVEGVDLRTLIRVNGALDPTRAARIVEQVGGALDQAHAMGLVHRDVKPANILVGRAGSEEHVYLTDFGIAKHLSAGTTLTDTGQFVGTIDYMAPEQLDGALVDGRADVYSLGCVFYEAITGAVPFPRESEIQKISAHLYQPPPVATQARPSLPAEVDEVVAAAMAKEPGDRYASAGELGHAAADSVQGLKPRSPAKTKSDSGVAARATASRREPAKATLRDVLFPLGGISGLLLIAFALPQSLLLTPSTDASVAELRDRFENEELATLAIDGMLLVSGLLMLFFTIAVRDAVRRAEGPNGMIAAVAFAGGVGAVVTNMVSVITEFVLAITIGSASNGTIRAIVDGVLPVANALTQIPQAIFCGAVSAAVFRFGVFPRWVGMLGVALAAAAIGTVAPTLAKSSAATAFLNVTFFMFLIWVAAVGLILARRAQVQRRTAKVSPK